MNRSASVLLTLVTLVFGWSGCAPGGSEAGWTTLVDATQGFDHFNRVGEATWTATDEGIQATPSDNDPAYLVSKDAYQDFVLRVEFWASDDANSGVFLRCQDPSQISDQTCYEANIFDQRPDPTYGTGAIVNVAEAPDPMPKAGNKWNTYEITAQGARLVLVLNGTTTVDVEDSKLASGPIALQWGSGTIKFRKVDIRAL